ncbi:MAG: SAM-dependent methyltransferase [Phycisphaeraceae bacterium]|nr:SAM-dependent methyltransferase [Phycisphaeraceae bacterium]
MTAKANTGWLDEFGIREKQSPHFFASSADLTRRGARAAQSHTLRRAFDLLELDGVLCSDHAPLVYFKRVPKINASDVISLHKKFWNHGGAPLLVLIDPSEVHVYSGFARPLPQAGRNDRVAGFVEAMDRASVALRSFLPSVESGDFFRRHARSFNPDQRVDEHLLTNLATTREQLAGALRRKIDRDVLDGLLCRLVFTCYLFDRGVIDGDYLQEVGIPGAAHLRDVLGVRPRKMAKEYLYKLFRSLRDDFNGDLFSDDLDTEERLIAASHLNLLEMFFLGTDRHGQRSFWPYNFGVIPVETISAIYERFLKPSDKASGSFYTPRFLVEVVLDSVLRRAPSLVGRTFLDPSCGSGIFLVGVFNRIADEWNRTNPKASNAQRAKALLKLMRESLAGVDTNPTACRVTAFSLYLAYLDQLSPRGIREIQAKKGALPRLVTCPSNTASRNASRVIWCGDFFDPNPSYPTGVDFVIGNPPWGSTAGNDTAAAYWCATQDPPVMIPDKQIAAAFVRKAPMHVSDKGRVAFVLPHGMLFNHGAKALRFQYEFFDSHAVDLVLNLVDYRYHIFSGAIHPAIVISYQNRPSSTTRQDFEYVAPKVNWTSIHGKVMKIMPQDRSRIRNREVLNDLTSEDAPQVWKRRFWATPRDWRLIDRLSTYPRLRDHVRQSREKGSEKPWLISEGFQPFGKNDDPTKAVELELPSKHFIDATSDSLDLFLLQDECTLLRSRKKLVRGRSNKQVAVFRGPHVLVSKGLSGIAYAGFDVSFQHALRGISGPKEDRNLLMFLAAYLHSPLSRYFLFHTSSNWGVYRPEVHVEELLRLPFVLPDDTAAPKASWKIVHQVVKVMETAAKQADGFLCDREGIVRGAIAKINPLVDRYFDILPTEKLLVEDTVRVVIPSVQPRTGQAAPTIVQASGLHRSMYIRRLCATLNGWSKNSGFTVQANQSASSEQGIGVIVLQRSLRDEKMPPPEPSDDVLAVLDRLRDAAMQKMNSYELASGVMVFDEDMIFIVKPLSYRFWTRTAALNDADEIAGSILMKRPEAAI